jgi:hypothetical protein
MTTMGGPSKAAFAANEIKIADPNERNGGQKIVCELSFGVDDWQAFQFPKRFCV